MATFAPTTGATVTFSLLLDGAGLEATAAVNVRHIPGGNVSYIDNGGQELPTFKCRGKFATFAAMYALMLLAGQTGVLTYSEAVMTVKLRSVSRSRAMGTGVQLANLDLVVVSVP